MYGLGRAYPSTSCIRNKCVVDRLVDGDGYGHAVMITCSRWC